MSRVFLCIVLFGLSLVSLFGCGGGAGGIGLDGQDFSVSPSALSFTAQIDAEAPPSKTVSAVAKGAEIEEPDVIYTTDVIDDCIISFTSDDTLTVTVHVKLPAMLGIGTHTTNLTIANSNQSRTIPITYTITDKPPGDPQVNYVAPYIVMSGRHNDVVVRGSGFKLFDDSNTPSVSFNSTPGSNITVVNDTKMRVTAPALSVGTYAVTVAGTTTAFESSAELEVIGPQTFKTTSITTFGEKSRIIFDARQNTLFVVNTTMSQIERYAYQSGTTWNLSTQLLPGLKDMALSPDGAILVAVSGSNFYEVDPVSLSLSNPIDPDLLMYDSVDSIAMANDGKAVAVGNNQWSGIYVYDLVQQQAFQKTYLNPSYNEVGYQLYAPRAYALPDGSGIYLGETGITTTNLFLYDATDGSVTETDPTNNAQGFYGLSCDSSKSTFVINAQDLYDSTLTQLSSLPESHSSAVMDPDGDTVYAVNIYNTNLRAFDISDPTSPAQLGSDATLTPALGLRPITIISPDGNTLFVTGRDSLHIIDLTTFTF